MSQAQDVSDADKLGTLPFVIAGISFVPLLGIPFAITAIVWGLSSRKAGAKKLALIGACGALCTVILYGGLYYFGFVQRGGVFDELRVKLAQTQLNSLVPAIELHKTQYGAYPESLEALRKTLPKESTVFIHDSSHTDVSHPRQFFYERVGPDHYYVRGVGQDGIPFTPDDLVPEIAVTGKLGLLKERQPR